MHQKQVLREVWSDMQTLIGEHGKIVIAGGAVRDAMMNKPAKDYDVFILNNGTHASWREVGNARF